MSAPTPPPYARTSARRWLKRLAFVSLLAALGYGALWLGRREVVRIGGTSELRDVTAETDHSDPDWRWESIVAARRKPPPGQNSADLVPRIQAAKHPKWLKEFEDPKWRTRLEPAPNVRYSPSIIAQARRELEASAEAVRLARTLKNLRTGHRELTISPNYIRADLDLTQFTRTVAELLNWDGIVATEDGDRARTADNLFAMLNTSRSIGDEPLMYSQSKRAGLRTGAVIAAERAIALSLDLPALSELQTELAADAEEPLLMTGFRGQRAALDQLFDNLYSGAVDRDSFGPPGVDSAPRLAWWHYRGWIPSDRAYSLRWMNRCVELAKLPMHEQIAPFREMRLPEPDEPKILSRLLLDGNLSFVEIIWKETAFARCAVVGIACERFRQKHNRWPNDLAELVPAYLTAIPLDPYSGESLRSAKSDDGCVVSSVGKSRGFGDQYLKAIGRQPPQQPPIQFRLWNPDHRRQPAPPDPAPEP